MTHKEVYVCDRCGAEYKTPAEAEKCEKSHRTIKGFEAIAFNRTSQYPLVMAVTFDDGKRIRYLADL